jgi:hypothetical protein
MRIVFYVSDKPREKQLGKMFCAGAMRHGHDAVVVELNPNAPLVECDAACMVGVKSKSLFARVQASGATPVIFDKGYIRSRADKSSTWEYWRVSIGDHQPTRTTLMSQKFPADRFERLEVEVAPWRRFGIHIVIAGSSAKYHQFYDLPDPTTYWNGVIQQLKQVTDRPIVYRPKPSWREAVPIQGSYYSNSKQDLSSILLNAFATITHGSNACFESIIAGIPSVVLGDAVAAPISSTTLDDIEAPLFGKRDQWFHNLAYHQWTEHEMQSGEAWTIIGPWIESARKFK